MAKTMYPKLGSRSKNLAFDLIENLGSTNYYLKEESTAALYLACFRWQLCRTRERTALKCPGLPWCTWLRRRRGRNTCHRYRPMLLPRVDLITDHLPKLSKILPCLALFFYSFSLKNWRERGPEISSGGQGEPISSIYISLPSSNNPNPVSQRESSLLGIGPYRYANTEDSRELNRVVQA